MARESTAIIGSGLNPLKKNVCRNNTTGESYIHGTNVNVTNPEDFSAGGSGLVTLFTLGNTAAQIPSTPLKYRRSISIYNNGSSASDIIYFGFDPSVTTGDGYPIRPGCQISMDINGEIPVWAVSAGTATDVRILELS
jgi:hypothetical protein